MQSSLSRGDCRAAALPGVQNSSTACRNTPWCLSVPFSRAERHTSAALYMLRTALRWRLHCTEPGHVRPHLKDSGGPCSSHGSVVGFAILSALPRSFVALPAADSGERPTAALPGCRPAHVALVQAAPPRCIPSHLSPHSSTCISGAAAPSRSRTPPQFFHPQASHNFLMPKMQWASQLAQRFSTSGPTSTSFSSPQSPQLCTHAVMGRCH